MKKIVIAIDGFSSTGKSTIAKRLANALHYIYVDTGAMYRAVTLFAMRHDLVSKDAQNIQALIKLLPQITLRFERNDITGATEIVLNGENVEQEIRSMEVSNLVSTIAAVPEVRYKLREQQRKMGAEKGIVMDGRDIGTVVFPDAELKLFMTASSSIRAKRRYKELIDKGEEVSYEEVLRNIELRDKKDSTRKDSPLKMADDAIEFDNSDMGLEEQFERILNFAHRITE